MKTKWLAIGIILLFVAIAVNPITGIPNNRDDTTPPLTTISLTPPEPDGENSWYVSKVTATLNATDNESGVNKIEYQLDGGGWQTYLQPFNITTDCHHKINYRSIDNAGNTEPAKNVTFKMDRTKPLIALNYTWEGNYSHGFNILFTATVSDKISGIDRVEFYRNDVLQETVNGSGPDYVWVLYVPPPPLVLKGLICKTEITDAYVKFYAVIVLADSYWFLGSIKVYAYDNAGNWDFEQIMEPTHPFVITSWLYLFKNIILPNNYSGYIGRFFIKATFNNNVE